MLTYIRPTDINVASATPTGPAPTRGHLRAGGYAPHLYYGIRRYPYSHDKTKNPLTFTDIQHGNAAADHAAADSGADGPDNSEVHSDGRGVDLDAVGLLLGAVPRHAPATPSTTASQQMRDYLVASLKLTPNDPTFIEARDAGCWRRWRTRPSRTTS